jgi:hypothetical protein
MPTVSELTSKNIGNAITNVKTWGGIIYNVKEYKVKGDGTTDDYTGLSSLINTTINGENATIVFPEGTFKLGSSITFPSNINVWFLKGGMLSPDSGVTVTIEGSIKSGLYQIFEGDGSIVFTRSSREVYPEWFGANDLVSDSSLAIQKAHDSCIDNRVPLRLTQRYYIENKLEWSNLVPCLSDMGSRFFAYNSNPNCIDLASGNYTGKSYFPYMDGFSGYAMKLKATSVGNIFIPTIANCGDALILETIQATHPKLLDTNVEIQQIGNCVRGIVFRADDAANVMQGNEIKCNFISTTKIGVEFENNALASSPNWDSNKVEIQAYDPTTVKLNAIGLYNPNTYAINRLIFKVETWCGGLASTAKFVDGRFADLDLFINTANVPKDGQISVIGTNNKLNFNDMDGANNSPIEVATTAGSKATFNGGAPLYKRKVNLKATLATDFGAGITRLFYVYHQCTDENSDNFTVIPGGKSGTSKGVIVDQVFDNSITNDDEIVIQVRNVSGVTITSGTVIYLTLYQII